MAIIKLRKIYYLLPLKARVLIRRLYYLPYDLIAIALNKKHRYEPPKGKIYVGSGDFIKQGENQLQLLIRYTDIKPNHHLLDVGCGIGRTAAALTEYLDPDGEYIGFDIVKDGIDWCRKKIGKDYSNFSFYHFDLDNDLYNRSINKAEIFDFPFDKDKFDIVFLFSVFTHMQPSEVKNYLNEIYRVLKFGGQCLCTFFLYENKNLEQSKDFTFNLEKGNYRLMSKCIKSANVAYKQDYIKKLIFDSGFEIVTIQKGYWREDIQYKADSFQDIIVISK